MELKQFGAHGAHNAVCAHFLHLTLNDCRGFPLNR